MPVRKRPVSINISNNDVDDTDYNNVAMSKKEEYENYVIEMNKKLQLEILSNVKEINDLNIRINELEEDVSKEEQRRTYMKGLMHNLLDIKKKTAEINKKHTNITDTFYQYNLKLDKTVFSTTDPETLSLIVYYKMYFIFICGFTPIVSYFINIISLPMLLIVLAYQIIPVTILYSLLYTDPKYLAFNGKEFKYIDKTYRSEMTLIKELKKDVNNTEDACKCLDNYIDEI